MKEKYKKENLEKHVKDSYSIAEVARKLGLKEAGGTYNTIKKYINEYQLDTSHFTGQLWNKGKSGNEVAVVPLDDILKDGTNYKSKNLVDRLVEAGLKEYKCEICGIEETWQGKPIRLELHHIDSNHYNNSFENLQILCPNCHSQTDGYRRRGTKTESVEKPKPLSRNEDKACEYCGKMFHPERKSNRYCSRECYQNALKNSVTGNSIPFTKDQIVSAMQDVDNFVALGKKLGVSKTSAKKYTDHYNLTEEFKQKYTFKRKPVLQFDLNENFVKEWSSVTEAEQTLGISHIHSACYGKRQTAGGYIWKYKE